MLCVAWSRDGRYVLSGGEDDLVSVWSVEQRTVVARGQGHQSWVNAAAQRVESGLPGQRPICLPGLSKGPGRSYAPWSAA